MRMTKEWKISQKVHKKFQKHYEDVQKRTPNNSEENFWARVKRQYHSDVYFEQLRADFILSENNKKQIYERAIENQVRANKIYNKFKNENNYIPKKYR